MREEWTEEDYLNKMDELGKELTTRPIVEGITARAISTTLFVIGMVIVKLLLEIVKYLKLMNDTSHRTEEVLYDILRK